MKSIRFFKTGSRVNWLLRETFVVVLGVLIALGLNDYWTKRNERALELQYLKRMYIDLSADAATIDDWYGELLQKKILALETIAPIIRGEAPVPDDVNSFLRNIVLGGSGGTSATSWVTSTTIDDLKSTGNLRLIGDVDLRGKITRYYSDSQNMHIRTIDRRTNYMTYVSAYLPILDGDLDMNAQIAIDTDRAVENFRSMGFLNLLNQEYNVAVFKKQIRSASAKQLADDIKSYIEAAGGNI